MASYDVVVFLWLVVAGMGVMLAVTIGLLILSRRREKRLRRAVVSEGLRERRRIARELHDIGGHRLLGMVIYARQVAALLPEAQPTAAAIEHLALDMQNDIRAALGILRAQDCRNESLARNVLGMGSQLPGIDLTVELDDVAKEPQLHEGVRHAGLRVIQEGITNAVKHGSGPVNVRVGFGAWLDVVITSGPGPSPRLAVISDGGQGLFGIRERVTEFGGDFDCGTGFGGEFILHIRIPAAPPADADLALAV